jgi:hypothetical protein
MREENYNNNNKTFLQHTYNKNFILFRNKYNSVSGNVCVCEEEKEGHKYLYIICSFFFS